MAKVRGVLFLVVLFASSAFAQQVGTERKVLLSDMTIQMECTEAVDALYNFDFETAEKQFTWLKQKNPNHPLPYFLMGLSQWWRIMPNDIVTSYDEAFFAYMDSTIYFAQKLYKEDKLNPEASFFLAGAYGFKARLQSDRDNFTSAAFTSKNSLNYLHENRDENEELGPEFVFGEALYNYYREWIPENMPKLKPILLFFKKGDKEKGLNQLKDVADNAFYTRVEAATFLMRIYNEYEKKYAEATKYSEYLHESYPNNPYFHRYLAKVSFTRGQLMKVLRLSEEMLERVDAKQVGYDEECGRVGAYFAGYVNLKLTKDTLKAGEYFVRCVHYTNLLAKWDESIYERGYYLNALRFLGMLYDDRGDKKNALVHYDLYLEHGNKESKYYSEAKAYVKANREKKEDSWWKLW